MHMAWLMPLPLTVSCFSKIQIGLTFLVPATWVVLEKGLLQGVCVCVCVSIAVDYVTVWRAVAPVVTCPTYEYSADVGSKVTITCTVSANPSSRVTWSAVVQSDDDSYGVHDDASVRVNSAVRSSWPHIIRRSQLRRCSP